MNKLICICGMPGAGKSIASDYLASKGFQFVRFGQVILDIVKEKHITPNEKNERKIREDLRSKYGMEAVAVKLYPKFKKLLKSGNVVADGLYSWSEYKYLKVKFPKQLVLIAIYAPPQLRYERISSRVMPKTDTNLRNRPFTKKEAKTRDYAEIENLEKGGPIAMADYTIINTKDKDFVYQQLDEILKRI